MDVIPASSELSSMYPGNPGIFSNDHVGTVFVFFE